MKDEEYLLKHITALEKGTIRAGSADKKTKQEYETLKKVRDVLCEKKKHIRFGKWEEKDKEILNNHLFITAKPSIYLVNLSEKDYIRKKNKWLAKIKEWVDANDPGALIIPLSCVLEQTLADMPDDEAQVYLKEKGATSALAKIIVNGYKALQLQYFFTAGEDEVWFGVGDNFELILVFKVKAWTIMKGMKAPTAAGRIHSDMERGFIMAEVMHYDDFKECGSEAATKAAGKYRQQGKTYVVQDGDIMFIKFNAGAGLTAGKKK